jgi:peptidoglycan/LPS O-acetylase OafA/YrhL
MRYITKLDGCRAFAVLAVLCAHYFTSDHLPINDSLGLWGVQLFFVISGYLITKILLNSRDLAKQQGGKFEQLRIFYIRRVLRIFPAYYALILGYLILGVEFENGSLWSCLLYVFNFHEAVSSAEFKYLGHLWTLCIEEQFYMIWPWLMLFIPRKRIVLFTLTLIVLSIASRGALSLIGVEYLSIRNLPTSQLDSLCGGALLAQLELGYAKKLQSIWKRIAGYIALVGVGLTAAALTLDLSQPIDAMVALAGPAFVSLWIVYKVSIDAYSKATGFLDFAPLRHIGKVSYGVYLFQFVSLFPLYKLMTMAGNPEWMSQPVIYALIWAAITITISALSWNFFEYPISKLKKHFNYRK